MKAVIVAAISLVASCSSPSERGVAVPQSEQTATAAPTTTGRAVGIAAKTCGPQEVHAIGVYETRSDHDFAHRPVGKGRVTIERPGNHVLVLSAYEPTAWHVTLARGATLASIHLIGYHAQTVNVTSVPVTTDSYEQGGLSECGYSLPYDDEGCDTDALIALAEARAGAPLTTFHGCYRASDWTIHADGTASSTCDVAAGYEEYEFIREGRFSSCGDP